MRLRIYVKVYVNVLRRIITKYLIPNGIFSIKISSMLSCKLCNTLVIIYVS